MPDETNTTAQTRATDDPPIGPQAVPEKLPESYLPYWARVQAGLAQAEQELAQAARLEEQARLLRQSAGARVGAYESFCGHLYDELHLDERAQRIEPDGRITWVPTSSPNGTAG